MLKNQPSNQQGYILLSLLLIIFLAGTFVLLKSQSKSYKESQNIQHKVKILKQIKQRLLIHAQQTPQIYLTNSNKIFLEGSQVASPGYLPCPNTQHNATGPTAPCGMNKPYAYGRLPIALATRHFEFLNNHALAPYIWYLVDSRYVTENNDYTESNKLFKFAPLNPNNPAKANLSFNQQDNLVALLIWPLDNQPIDYIEGFSLNSFTNKNSLVVSISHQEWAASIFQIVEAQKEYLCQIDDIAQHWFNNCTRTRDTQTNCQLVDVSQQDETNPTGSNWREILCESN